MRLLLDTNILIAVARRKLASLGSLMRSAVVSSDNLSFVSAASLWEISLKTRIGKLEMDLAPEDLPDYFQAEGMVLLAIDHRHAVTTVDPAPDTRDPFDRMLLAQCAVEDLRLVTIDRVLAAHPLAWRP